jgi:hypothetical protein
MKMRKIMVLTGLAGTGGLGLQIAIASVCYTSKYEDCSNFQDTHANCPNSLNIRSITGVGDQKAWSCVSTKYTAAQGCEELEPIDCVITVTTIYCDGTSNITTWPPITVKQRWDDDFIYCTPGT